MGSAVYSAGWGVNTGSARRATFQRVINTMNTSWLFYKLAPTSNGKTNWTYANCIEAPLCYSKMHFVSVWECLLALQLFFMTLSWAGVYLFTGLDYWTVKCQVKGQVTPTHTCAGWTCHVFQEYQEDGCKRAAGKVLCNRCIKFSSWLITELSVNYKTRSMNMVRSRGGHQVLWKQWIPPIYWRFAYKLTLHGNVVYYWTSFNTTFQ